jgi:hypothetical protein
MLGAIYVFSESVQGTIADARYYDGMVLNLNKAELSPPLSTHESTHMVTLDSTGICRNVLD